MTGNSFYSMEKALNGRSGGTTQAETRLYNERLVLSLIRRHGPLSKVELTRLTGLSAQTITTLVNHNANLGLLVRGEPQRGRLGQPSVPYGLNPVGAYSIGLKIDRRNAEIAIINFVGQLVAFERQSFAYPTPGGVVAFAVEAIPRLLAQHPEIDTRSIAGLGIASPFRLWDWSEEIGAPPGGLLAWRDVDVRAELDARFSWPVYLFNDAMVAAGAELMFGAGTVRPDFLYLYVGYLIGGGLVLDHHLFPGRNKRAGAVGEMLVPALPNSAAPAQTLIAGASLYRLSERLGDIAPELWSKPDDWGDLGPPLEAWLEEASYSVAQAIETSTLILDLDCCVIDGAFPEAVRTQLVRSVRERLGQMPSRRVDPLTIVAGSFGHLAPSIGGATIPLIASYSTDKDLLFKE